MATVSSIANASQGQLLCITYELFLHDLKEAQGAEGENRKEYLSKALEVLKTLTADLNFEVPISQDLFRLYIYVQGILVNCKVTNEELENVYQIMEMLYMGFAEITSNEEETAPSMKNIETIYAGITYGKNDLNEMVISDRKRGFKA